MEKFQLYAELYETESRFNRACQQLLQLNERLDELKSRYTKARESNNNIFRFNLRMKIMVTEGLIETYCHYASLKNEEGIALRSRLYGETPAHSERRYNLSDDDDNDEMAVQ